MMNNVISELYKVRSFCKEGRLKSLHYEFYETETYNLIKQIFLSHPIVLPTVGQIKKVDFFVNQIPFGLKVTYFPTNFIEEKRKEYGLQPELAELKQQARKIGIPFQARKKARYVYYEVVQKLKDRDNDASHEVLNKIDDTRKKILNEAISNPRELIKNLYEKQGEMRFDASNRLFLILVDSTDYDSSWKLRRNLDLLKPTIEKYLDGFANKNYEDLKTVFTYSGEKYSCLADCVFVSK
jgi:vacuolar-type H+-ATPase subunit H